MSKLSDYLPTPNADPGDNLGLDNIDPTTHQARDAAPFRRIVAAQTGLEAAEQELRDAVAAARDAGDSWAVVGAALGTTRQNAYQRFGRQPVNADA